MEIKFEQPNIEVFYGQEKGLTLLIFGAVHGNELCGVSAIKKAIKDINSGNIILERGTVILVPICNPIAYKKRKRFIEENLNRVFKKWKNPNTYEKKLANYLTSLFDKCDIFLDIHSVSAKSLPLVFIDSNDKQILSFAKVIGVKYGLNGWNKLYQNNKHNIAPYDTISFAKKLNKKCLIVECGQHNNKKTKDFACSAIINTLRHFSFIEGKNSTKEFVEINMKNFFIRKDEKDVFPKNWHNFDKFKKGELLAIRKNGKKIIAKFDGLIIMPDKNAEIGTEWFYTGMIK